jgi:crotonobetainyl-CoA:carnitine CoA-transferase CaiB-like acyl-CoA transferase
VAEFPLKDIKVLDLSRVLAGPWASQTLADLGAEVIKIERPGVGDDTRAWGPPWFDVQEGEALSAYFMSANRGKKSVCIDLASSEGLAIVKQLADESDIVIENFKVGDMEKKGLDYQSLSETNARLIYCSITGFGQTGPYKQRPGYDFMIQGIAGLMSITGEPDEKSTDGPQKVGVAVADLMTGLYSTIAILAAIAERNESGEGQYIDMALMDVLTASLANQASNYLISGNAPGRMGNAHPNVVPYQTFAASDGHIIVAVGNDKQFNALCGTIDRLDIAANLKYLTNADRIENRAELAEDIQREVQTRTMSHWLEIFEQAGVPCGPINTIDKVFDDPQTKAREMQISIADMPLVANPMRFSKSNLNYELEPPSLGQHTDEVLVDKLAMSVDELSALRSKGVLG